MLISTDDKIALESSILTFHFQLEVFPLNEAKKSWFNDFRNYSISILENRDLPLPTRIALLGSVIEYIQQLKDSQPIIQLDLIPVNDLLISLSNTIDITSSFQIQKKLLLFFSEQSISIESISQEGLDYFSKGNEVELYQTAKQHLYSLFPQFDIWFEKVIVNHLLFEQFPFSRKNESLWRKYQGLCGIYLFTKFLTIGYMATKSSLNDLVDVISAAFRLIDHSFFAYNVSILLEQEEVSSLEQLTTLIYG